MRKYILIPEYRPLYAMRRCWGQTHGPLTKPCPVPVDVIGELLSQTGSEAVTIYEVKLNPDGSTTAPIQLTPENYMKPYDEIAGIKAPVDPIVENPEPVPVEPTVLPSEPDKDEKAEEESSAVEVPQESENTEVVVVEEKSEIKEEPAFEEKEETKEDDSNIQVISTPRLTKAEREAARRAAAQAAAQNNTSTEG